MQDMPEFLESRGCVRHIRFSSEKKPAAAHKARKLVKFTSGLFRCGINFSNLGAVIDGIRDHERGPVQPLPWGQWQQFPFIIEHKGERYLRLYPMGRTLFLVNGVEVDRPTYDAASPADRSTKRVTDWESTQMRVVYTVDGIEVDRNTFNSYLTPSEANRAEAPDCITVKERNCELILN
jgi:hypothetical protein